MAGVKVGLRLGWGGWVGYESTGVGRDRGGWG